MKKSLLVLILACFFSTQTKSQYSSILAAYPTAYELSAGFATKNTPGTLWFGYLSTVQNISTFWHVNKNFCIMGSGSSSIWSAYKIFETSGCAGTSTQVLNGYGVSAIETNGSGGEAYALAGSYDNASYFCTLDKYGNVISAMSYPFPYPPMSINGTPTQPIIIESDNKEEYYICGYFESDIYIINVDINGNIIWSSFYSIGKDAMPKDIIMSPYHKGELVVIGETRISPIDNQGFFMAIDGSSGVVNTTKVYGNDDEKDGFASIIVGSSVSSINSAGFVIGGYTQRLNNASGVTAWAVKLDPFGNFIWNKILEPSMGTNLGVIDIIERLNTFNNLEYYALLNSSVGMHVLKLDEKGNQFHISLPNSAKNEFVYDVPSTVVSRAKCISYVNIQTPGADLGIQVFGTANNFSGFSSSYVANAYFNGETNCNRTLAILQREDNGSHRIRFDAAVKHGSFSSCSNFQIQAWFPGGSVNYPCSGLMTQGSNQRTMPSGIDIQTNQEADFSVYPNPVANKTQVNYSISDNSEVNIYLHSLLGQEIIRIQPQVKLAGNYTEEIDFSSLGLKNGVYFVTTVVDGTPHKRKIIYSH
ncbi:T9SS type A sorting domain-containing protein [Aurantibacillus circumpalustris]|uniref:T9SS type A sorting domain-containing protein n=1 Tax=Aurantibacillus circumpalustris TaxID=3036359 RepID=UPI00295B87A2|nr:T9SS type A sorting domain-containing protein [Aurantibacillus circumpalustris]